MQPNSNAVIARRLKNGFDPNAQYNGWSALMHAVDTGNITALKELLEYGADPVFIDSNDETPLHRVTKPEILKILLQTPLRQYVNHRNNNGETPYYRAEIYGNDEIENLLLSCGADSMTTNRYGYLPRSCQQIL